MIRFASSLRARLIAFVLLAVIPAFGVILFTDQRHRASIAAQVQRNALGSVRVIATEQRRVFENAHQLLITLARLPQIREHNSVGCQKILSGLLEPLYVDLGVVDLNGNLLCNALGPNAYRSWRMQGTHIRRVVDSQDFSVGEIQKDSSKSKRIVPLGLPFGDSHGAPHGLVFVVLDYSWIARITTESHLPSEASFTLFDEKGRVFVRYPDAGELGDAQNSIELSSDTKLVRGIEGNIETRDVDQIARLITYRQLDHRIAGNIVYAGIDIPARAAFAEAERILRQNLILVGILTMLTLIAAWFGADLFVLRRVRDLMDATRQLTGGNLKARTRLPYGGSELGHLARTFDDLAKTLEQRAADAKAAESQIQRQHLRQRAIHEISAAMTSRLGVGNVLKALSQGVAAVFPSSFVTLSWVNEKRRLEPIMDRGCQDAMTLWSIAEREQGFPHEVLKLKTPLLITDVQSDFRAADPDSLRKAGFITYLGLPMTVKDEVVGVLSFYSTEAIDLRTEEENFLTDLTQQAAIALYNSRLYEQTRNQAVELERSNRIKDEFLGVISHELRTPLNIIMNCAEALNMGVFGEITSEHEKGTQKIKMQARHLLSLINGILEITKIETGVVTLNRERIDLSQLVAELESDYAMVSKEKSVTVNWQISADLPNIISDRMKLRQVVMNLVNNAIKFTDQGSVDICFSAPVNESIIEFSVKDTGIGIADEFLPHIFDKFRQIDSTTTRDYSGAGLGLYLVKCFVELMGGTVDVKSKLGEGTVFTVRIPVDSAAGCLGEEAPTHKNPLGAVDAHRYIGGEL